MHGTAAGEAGSGGGAARRRVLYLVHSSAPGGALLSLRYLLEQIDRARYEPVVACIHPVPGVIEGFRALGVETVHARGISIYAHTTGEWHPLTSPVAVRRELSQWAGFRAAARATEALVRQLRPDLVHLNSVGFAPSALGARRAGAKVVWHVRESVVPGHFGVRRRMVSRWLRRWAHRVIFISEDDRRAAGARDYGVVIPNFVDHRRFDRALSGAAVRAELGIAPGAPVALFVGGIASIKGGRVFLRAMKLARRRVPGLVGVVAGGEGPWSRSVAARVARAVLPLVGSGTERQKFLRDYRGAEGFVHLLPFRGDPERLLAASDLMVVPHVAPHFARAVIEAGAMARPVVGSRIGGVEELVDHGVTGLLVPPRDPATLADAIVHLLADPAIAARMGEAGYRASLERFGAARNVARVLEIYDELLGSADPGASGAGRNTPGIPFPDR
ncbi:MAG TPA: glycosyltransferase family 4 protein [Longimicrobium sp.]|nr:glycosyltransferase family 4 protein [Longimicrobium sp.]